jgi:lipoprotein-releasing system permease protein
MATSITQGYPVKMDWTDFMATLAVMSVLTIIISYRPAILAARFGSPQQL